MCTVIRHPPNLTPARLASLWTCLWSLPWRDDSRNLKIWLAILMPLVLYRSSIIIVQLRLCPQLPLEVARSELEPPLWTIAFRKTFARSLVVVILPSILPGPIRWFALEALPLSRISRSPSVLACLVPASESAALPKLLRATKFRLSILLSAFGDLVCWRVFSTKKLITHW